MIIKCPECGHQVSDKAPVCPSCGVEIAGNIIKCSNCGELYLKEEGMCPNCHHVESRAASSVSSPAVKLLSNAENKSEEVATDAVVAAEGQIEVPSSTTEQQATEPVNPMVEPETATQTTTEAQPKQPEATAIPILQIPESDEVGQQSATSATPNMPKKRSHTSLFIAILIAIVTGFVLLLVYNKTNPTNEKQEYELAIKSNDEPTLRQFLDKFPTAPKAHRDHIEAILARMAAKAPADNWEIVLKNNTKQGFVDFLKQNPNSPHKAEAIAKIDEFDWLDASAKNTENSYLTYVTTHPNGIHKAEADEKLKEMLVHTASKADQEKAVACVRQLLVGMNTKSKDKINGVVASQINFLGSSGATSKDIFRYMTDRLYQADVKTINWHLNTPAEVINTEGTDAGLEIKVPARLVIEREGGTSSKNYLIKAKIKDGRIYFINWNQL